MIAKIHFISQATENLTHLEAIEEACKFGVRWVQLRIKDTPESEVLNSAIEAKKICNNYNALLVINDYPSIAIKTDAYGLHLGKDDMPVREARKLVGNKIIGATANTIDDVIKHAENKADYIGLGPFRFTNTKKKLSPILGLAGYKTIMHECAKRGITIPVIAIGGIEYNDIPALMQTGIHGVAMSTAIINSIMDIRANDHSPLQHLNLNLNVNHSK